MALSVARAVVTISHGVNTKKARSKQISDEALISLSWSSLLAGVDALEYGSVSIGRLCFSRDEKEVRGGEFLFGVAGEGWVYGNSIQLGEILCGTLLDVEAHDLEFCFCEQFKIIARFETIEGHQWRIDPALPGLRRLAQVVVFGKTGLHVRIKVF